MTVSRSRCVNVRKISARHSRCSSPSSANVDRSAARNHGRRSFGVPGDGSSRTASTTDAVVDQRPDRGFDVRENVLDNSRLRALVNPSFTSLEDGLAAAWAAR